MRRWLVESRCSTEWDGEKGKIGTREEMYVKELRIYPIKSCAGVSVVDALVTAHGLALPSDPRISDR